MTLFRPFLRVLLALIQAQFLELIALEETEKSAGLGWNTSNRFGMDTPSGGGKQFDYHHLISENNTGDVPDALVEEEVILENNVQGEEQGQQQQQQQLALQQQQQQSLIVKQQQQQSQQKSQQLQQHLTQQQQYLQQKQTMLQNQKRGIQQAQSRKQPAQQKMLYTVVHSGNQHQQQVLVSNKSVRQPGPQQNQSVVKTSSQMQKINKNNVVLEGGGQYEEGQAYVIRDRYGNARTMLWQNGEFHPFDKDKGILIQHSVIDSSQRGRGARGGRDRGRGRGQGQCYGNATGVHMSPNVRGSSPMINNGVRQTKFNTPNVPIISVVTSPGLQGQVVQQRPKLPLQNLMPAAQIKSKPTDEASSEYKWSMDLGLFANEQYQSILDQLHNENGHSLPSMAEKMALSNKTAVCKYLL
ncbi:uncharacterized protein LOC132722624, partial [Ruditapes philippinarum]|uniref:uncharacterized protein LOC132722624 n=1 Tax=Ruditapes philippinarum TaxID=129788 RepID=UPI00295ADC88